MVTFDMNFIVTEKKHIIELHSTRATVWIRESCMTSAEKTPRSVGTISMLTWMGSGTFIDV